MQEPGSRHCGHVHFNSAPPSHPEKVSGDALAISHGLTDAEYFEEALRRSKAESAAARPGTPLETAVGQTEEQDLSDEREEQHSAGRRDRTEEFKPAGRRPASTPASFPFGWRQCSSREYGKTYYWQYTTMEHSWVHPGRYDDAHRCSNNEESLDSGSSDSCSSSGSSGAASCERRPGVCRALP